MLGRLPLVSRKRTPPRFKAPAKPATIPAPVGGYDAQSALESMPRQNAVQLKNWFPQPGYVEVRKGYDYHSWDIGSNLTEISAVDTSNDELDATAHGFEDDTPVRVYATTTVPGGLSASRKYYVVGSSADSFGLATSVRGSQIDLTSSGSGTIYVYEVSDDEAVESLPVWRGPSSSKMFAAAGLALWDVSSLAKAVPVEPGFSNDRWEWVNFAITSGSYLYMVNGADAPRYYNGSTWTEPTITGITASDAIGINIHKRRIFFVMSQSKVVAYLPVNSIAGAASTFDLGPIFAKGGNVVAMATWTRDGGSGSDDYAVFVTSEGEAAIYQGTDPSSADTWALVGVFDIPKPIGRRCFKNYGADVLINTVEGIYPLSQVLSVDKSQAKRVATSLSISPALSADAALYKNNFGWEMAVYSPGTRLILNVPTAEGSRAKQYVMNTLTGAWCEYDNHNAVCWANYNGKIYFGGPDGAVYEADKGSADVDVPIFAVGQCAYDTFKQAGNQKQFKLLKALVVSSGGLQPSLGISVDFIETSTLSQGSSASQSTSGSLWDNALWDQGTWGGSSTQSNDWVGASALGTFASVKFTATTGVNRGQSGWGISKWGINLWGGSASQTQTLRINGFVALYETGAFL